jgi:hypothetical protein
MGRVYKVVDALILVICLPFYAVALLVMVIGKLVPRPIVEKLRNWRHRRTLREGRVVSQFIACDVRRDILVVSAARIDEGIITGRVRTTNVLYLSKGLVREPEFEEARELRIDEMWRWTGNRWGGLPDGTSIVDHLHGGQSQSAGE